MTNSQAIFELAQSVRELQQEAARLYQPVVDAIACTRSREVAHIKHTLDALLDFCGHAPDPSLRMVGPKAARARSNITLSSEAWQATTVAFHALILAHPVICTPRAAARRATA